MKRSQFTFNNEHETDDEDEFTSRKFLKKDPQEPPSNPDGTFQSLKKFVLVECEKNKKNYMDICHKSWLDWDRNYGIFPTSRPKEALMEEAEPFTTGGDWKRWKIIKVWASDNVLSRVQTWMDRSFNSDLVFSDKESSNLIQHRLTQEVRSSRKINENVDRPKGPSPRSKEQNQNNLYEVKVDSFIVNPYSDLECERLESSGEILNDDANINNTNPSEITSDLNSLSEFVDSLQKLNEKMENMDNNLNQRMEKIENRLEDIMEKLTTSSSGGVKSVSEVLGNPVETEEDLLERENSLTMDRKLYVALCSAMERMSSKGTVFKDCCARLLSVATPEVLSNFNSQGRGQKKCFAKVFPKINMAIEYSMKKRHGNEITHSSIISHELKNMPSKTKKEHNSHN